MSKSVNKINQANVPYIRRLKPSSNQHEFSMNKNQHEFSMNKNQHEFLVDKNQHEFSIDKKDLVDKIVNELKYKFFSKEQKQALINIATRLQKRMNRGELTLEKYQEYKNTLTDVDHCNLSPSFVQQYLGWCILAAKHSRFVPCTSEDTKINWFYITNKTTSISKIISALENHTNNPELDCHSLNLLNDNEKYFINELLNDVSINISFDISSDKELKESHEQFSSNFNLRKYEELKNVEDILHYSTRLASNGPYFIDNSLAYWIINDIIVLLKASRDYSNCDDEKEIEENELKKKYLDPLLKDKCQYPRILYDILVKSIKYNLGFGLEHASRLIIDNFLNKFTIGQVRSLFNLAISVSPSGKMTCPIVAYKVIELRSNSLDYKCLGNLLSNVLDNKDYTDNFDLIDLITNQPFTIDPLGRIPQAFARMQRYINSGGELSEIQNFILQQIKKNWQIPLILSPYENVFNKIKRVEHYNKITI